MSSRFVRKTLGQTSQNDLAEVLQKVGLNKNVDDDENDDDGSELITSSSSGRRNLFEILSNDDDKNEDELDETKGRSSGDDQPTKQDIKSKSKRKRKSKKKKSQSENVEEIDDFLIISNEVQSENCATGSTSTESFSSLLSVDNRILNPLNEMKKKFGSAIVEQIERENNPTLQALSNLSGPRRRAFLTAQQRPTTRIAKQNSFIIPKLGWPQYTKFGLLMKPSLPSSDNQRSPGNYFQFELDKDYQKLQIQYLNFVDNHDLQGIMNIIRQYPYHIDALLHLSDMSRMQDDTPTAVDFIERALYSFQQSFHPLFSIIRGECRLEYRIQENRSFFLGIFKNIIYLGERGCPKTALEFCKVLLSLSPNEDPLAVLLLIDYFAIRCEEYRYLIRFHSEQNDRLNLNGLPNFSYSVALAHFRTQNYDRADELLQDALLRFPSVLKYLTDKLSIRPDKNVENSAFFMKNDGEETNALKCVQQLYAVRIANEWKERGELEFLRINTNKILDIIKENRDPRIERYRNLRQTAYRKTPINICRHIVLSESNEIRGFLPNDLENGRTFYSFDPFPPQDSTSCFVRPPRPTMEINSSYNPFGMIIRSLLPNFNLEDYLVPANNERGAVGGAGAAARDQSNDEISILQAIQESIRNLIVDIGINNIGEEDRQEWREDDGDDANNHEFD